MATIYEGRVFSGIGRASTRVRQNAELYKEVCGVDFVPGTLNVMLTRELQIPPESIYLPPERIKPKEKNRGVTLIPARLCDESVFIILPDRSGYDKTIVELMAAFNIREKLGLQDGDVVRIEL